MIAGWFIERSMLKHCKCMAARISLLLLVAFPEMRHPPILGIGPFPDGHNPARGQEWAPWVTRQREKVVFNF